MACVIVTVLVAAAATVRVMRIAASLLVSAMPTVSMMHKQMHQRTGQQQQKWQVRNDVSPVLGQQEVRGNGKEAEEEPVDTAGAANGNVMGFHGRFFLCSLRRASAMSLSN
jgi:hypothetical protein